VCTGAHTASLTASAHTLQPVLANRSQVAAEHQTSLPLFRVPRSPSRLCALPNMGTVSSVVRALSVFQNLQLQALQGSMRAPAEHTCTSTHSQPSTRTATLTTPHSASSNDIPPLPSGWDHQQQAVTGCAAFAGLPSSLYSIGPHRHSNHSSRNTNSCTNTKTTSNTRTCSSYTADHTDRHRRNSVSPL